MEGLFCWAERDQIMVEWYQEDHVTESKVTDYVKVYPISSFLLIYQSKIKNKKKLKVLEEYGVKKTF